MKDVAEMTTEELRLEIARLQGWTEIDEAIGEAKNPNGRWRLLVEMPDWPDDIAVAWELVEEAKISGFHTCIEWAMGSGMDVFTWWAEYLGDVNYVAQGDTATLAICRAYVAWKRGQK